MKETKIFIIAEDPKNIQMIKEYVKHSGITNYQFHIIPKTFNIRDAIEMGPDRLIFATPEWVEVFFENGEPILNRVIPWSDIQAA